LGRAGTPFSSHPFQRHGAADVAGKVLQSDLGFRPRESDRPYDPGTRRVLPSTEYVLDAGPTFVFWRFAFSAPAIADDCGSRDDESGCASSAS
jgi:hypothetical protein